MMLFIVYLRFLFYRETHFSRRRTLCTITPSLVCWKNNGNHFFIAYGKIPTMKRNNHRPTPFQTKVYEATSCIPHGKVATYGWVARKIGRKSAQAVGGALRANPFAPKVPCHRVVSADGSLHGFAGHTSGPLIAKKRRLLQEEGIVFDARERVIKGQILRP